jgi:hypothetical protein
MELVSYKVGFGKKIKKKRSARYEMQLQLCVM